MNNLPNITPEMISAYQQDLEANSSPATAKRRAASLKKFFNWAEDQGHIPQNPYPQPVQNVPMYPSPMPSVEPIMPSQPEPKKKNAGPYIFTGAMTLALLVIIFLLLGKVKFPIPFELPSASDDTSVVTQNSTPKTDTQVIIASAYKIFADLSLKNGSGQPITTPQTVSFKVYSSPTGQDALYTSPTQQITPSASGSVSAIVENVPTELFFENKVLYIAPVTAEGEIAERIPVSTANVASNLQGHFPETDAVSGSIPVIGTDGSLLLASDNPAIKGKTGNLLIEGKAVTIASPTASDGDITINPDGSGKINLITEGASGNVINATATNLNSGTLYSGIVANGSTGYYLIKLQSGSTPTTKFSVDAQGNTFMAGSMDFGGGLKVGGVERITNLGNLTNINGYSGTGVFSLSQTASNYFGITKTGATSATDSATLTLNETGVTASGYDTLVLNRIGGDSNAYALNVATGNANFGGNMVISGSVDLGGLLELGNFAAAPSSAGEGSMFYNTSDSTVYVFDGSTWNAVGSGGTSDFASITDGTNTTATMVVGSGASLTPTGTGIIEATELTCTGCVLGTEIAADTLDFSNFADSMSLDAATNINLGSSTFSTSGTGAMDFNSTGQISFAGNVNAENGLDVTNANFTVGATNFTIDYSTGDTTTAGDILVNGGNITTTSGNLLINPNGTLTLGTTTQPVTLQGSTNSITSNGAGNDITLTSADQIIFNAGSTIEAQDNVNVTGDLSTTGNVAVNGGNLTSTAATLIINAAGNVDVQDVLNADSITTDTGGVTIAASQSYTGLGAVTYRSANASTLTINSGTTGSISIGTDASDEVISIGNGTASKTMTIGSVTGGSMLSLQGGTNGINLGDDGIAKTIDIGGTDSDAANTIRIGTGSTSADAITIGNSNASTTLGLTGGTAWSISTTGNLTTSGDIYVNGDDIFSDGNLTLDATSTVIIPDADTFQTNDVTSTGALNVTSNTTNAATFDSGTTGAVNIGTGANSKTVTLGNTSTSTSVVLTKGASGNITLSGFDCTSFANGGTLTTDSSGNITCADDNAATGGSGSVAWSDITAPTNNLSLSHSAYTTSMSWTATGTLSPWTMNLTNNAGSSTSQNFVTLNNAVTTQTGDVNTEALLLLNNADTAATGSTIVDNAILITNSGGISNGITDAIDASASDIVNALNFGANTILGTTGDIDMTNFDVVGSSGNITTAGTLAVNGDSITADGTTLVINAAGTVDVQDTLNANDITTDTGGVSIAAGQSYTGAGAVTLSSANASLLTINSGTTGGIDIGTDSSNETLQIGNGAAVKTVTVGSTNTTSATTIQSGTGDITLSSGDRVLLNSAGTGGNGLNELFSLTASGNLANTDELLVVGDSTGNLFMVDGEGNTGIYAAADSMQKLTVYQDLQNAFAAVFRSDETTAVAPADMITDTGIGVTAIASGDITSDAFDGASRELFAGVFQATDTGNLSSGGQTALKDIRGISAVGEDLAITHVSGISQVYGGHFTANGSNLNVTGTAYGIYATAQGADTNYAGYFVGDIYGSTNLTLAGDLNVNGGDLATTATTFNIGVGNTGTINFTDGTYDLIAIKDQGDYPFFNVRGKSDTGDPATCAEGDIYYNAADDAVKVCHASNVWEDLDGGVAALWTSDTGTLYPTTITDNVGIGSQTAADIISKLFVTNDSTETGKALAIFDQTEDEDIFSASASSITKFKIAKNATEYDVVIDRYLKNLTDSLNSIDLNNGSNGLGFRSSKNVNFYLDQDSNNTDEAFSISTNNGTANLFFVEGISNGGGTITPQVGIGTITPESYLHVSGATDGKALVILSETGNQNIITASAGATTVFNLDRSGNISSSGVFQVGDPGASNTTTFNRIGTNSPAESSDISTNEDLLISEDLEIDGTLYLIGNIIANRESTGAIILCADGSLDCSDPTQVVNSLTAGSWEVQNTSNVGKAALMVVQDNNQDLFTASASSDTKFTIHNDGSLTLEGMASTTHTDEATIYYDTDVDHLYLRGGDSAWHRVALDMTKYSANDASVDNQDYVEIAHNQNTNDINVVGWFYNTVTSLWQKIEQFGKTVEIALANEFNPAFNEKYKATALALAYSQSFGDGADGAITVSANKNINTDTLATGRSCADGGDGVVYNVATLTANTAVVSDASLSSGCINVGDEILLINIQGSGSSVANTGNYEFLEVSNVNTGTKTVTFSSNKRFYYGENLGDDTNLGTTSGTQKVLLQRVPNYTTVTVNSGVTLTANAYNGSKGGIVAFRANSTVTVTGTITTTNLGHQGPPSVTVAGAGYEGSSYDYEYATTTTNAHLGAGGGGCYNSGSSSSGGGGAYATDGSDAAGGGSCGLPGLGGDAYGDAALNQLYFGSSGGSGANDEDAADNASGLGGDGGGIVFISAGTLTVTGAITSNGQNGGNAVGTGTEAGGGGGGAGGSIYLNGGTVTLGTSLVTATAGTGGTGSAGAAGAGSVGRIAVYYTTAQSGSTSPASSPTFMGAYNYSTFVSEEIHTPGATNYDNIQWTENLDTYGEVQVQTRSGATPDSTDGTWEAWKPTTTSTTVQSMDTDTEFTSSTLTVANGTETRNLNYYEDENELTPGNTTNFTSTAFTVDTAGTLESSLIGYWKMAESSTSSVAVTRADSYGSSNLTDTGLTASGTGKIGNAADFESGGSDFMERADSAALSTGDIDFTIGSWVQLESTGADRMIITKSESATIREYELYYNNTTSRFNFVLYNSGGTAVCTAVANNLGAPSLATWYYIVAWHDSSANTCNIQVNNGTADSATETGVSTDNASSFRIGARYATEALFHDGLVDEVGFWKKVLSSTEKTDLYNSGNGSTYLSSGEYAEDTIVSADLSSYDYLTFWAHSTIGGSSIQIGMGESAATELTENVYIDAADTWQKVYWDLSDITGTARDGITKLRVTNLSTDNITITLDNIKAESYLTTPAGSTITSTANEYIQYRVILSTTQAPYRPSVSGLKIQYDSPTGNNLIIDADSVRVANSASYYSSTRNQVTERNLRDYTNIRTSTQWDGVTQEKDADLGTGQDGDITVTTSKDINTTTLAPARTCADGIQYNLLELTSDTARLESPPASNCLAVGDEVMLINIQGTDTSVVNTGNYEFFRIESINQDVVTFTNGKTKYYGDGASDDTNIGIAAGTQKVLLQRIPNYNDVTVTSAGTITASTWNGTKGGIVAFRSNGVVSVAGAVTTSQLGFQAGITQTGPGLGYNGGSQSSESDGATPLRNMGGGGGGCYATNAAGSGSGGGYAFDGGLGFNHGSCTTLTEAGYSYGDSALNDIFLGSAGGSGANDEDAAGDTGGAGGDGGGIIIMTGDTITVSGSVSADGQNGGLFTSAGGEPGQGGGGSGGSILIRGNVLNLGSNLVTASGGASAGGATRPSGAGSVGRIATYYSTSLTGTSTPTMNSAYSPNNAYTVLISDEIATPDATDFAPLSWHADTNQYGMIEFQTRTGNSNNSTDGTWDNWLPATADTNIKSLSNANTHTDWTGTNVTVADGDVTRDVDYYEEEDEATAGNITKMTSSTNGGYAEDPITSVNLNSYDYISFWVRSSQIGNVLTFGMGESAATEQTETITIDNADTWQKVYWDITDIPVEEKDAITTLRITNLTTNSNTFYIDNVTADRYLTDSTQSHITSVPKEFVQYRAILTSTNSNYKPTLYNVNLSYNTGYKLVQTDANTVRLYNYTGQTQQIRLDAIVFGADLAEWYTVNSTDIEPGDIVATTGLTDDYGVPILRKANSVSDKGLIGGISTKAGKELGLEAEDRRLLALAGRIPVKMSDSSLPIKSGDGITSSVEPGKGQKAKVGQMIIGKALEDWSPESGKKTVMVLVGNSIQTVNPEEAQQYAVMAANTIEEGAYVVATQAGETLDNVGAFASVIAANIQAGLIETQELIATNIESGQVKTNIISPLAGETDVNIQIGTATESGVLAIQNADGTTVSAFDSEGNATISGSLTTNEIRTGTIYADQIIANGGKFAELASSTQSAITRDEVEELLRSAEDDILALQNNLNSSIHTATDSANLDNITATNMYLSDSLITNAITTSNTLTVGNDFVISSTIEDDIEQIAMNTLTAPLKIQSLAMAPVEIMAGKFKIDTNGDVSIDGNLYVAGDIYAQGLNLSAVEENEDLLTLRSKDNNQVARVDASGSASFGSLTTDKIVIAGSETATDSAVLEGEIKTNATAGKTYIPEGTNEIIIRNPKVTNYTLVYVTPTSDTQNLVLYVKEKGEGYFKVGFTSPVTTDVNFNWWIIEIQ